MEKNKSIVLFIALASLINPIFGNMNGICNCYGTYGLSCRGRITWKELSNCSEALSLNLKEASLEKCLLPWKTLPLLQELELKQESQYCRCLERTCREVPKPVIVKGCRTICLRSRDLRDYAAQMNRPHEIKTTQLWRPASWAITDDFSYPRLPQFIFNGTETSVKEITSILHYTCLISGVVCLQLIMLILQCARAWRRVNWLRTPRQIPTEFPTNQPLSSRASL